MINSQQIIKIHAMLPDEIKGDREAKSNLVQQYTKDPLKVSTKDLTFDQANQMITDLGGSAHTTPGATFARFDKDNAQHKYILSMCQNIGWSAYNGRLRRNVADLTKLSNWLEKRGYLKKPLMKYTPQELPKLVHQFEQMVQNTEIDV